MEQASDISDRFIPDTICEPAPGEDQHYDEEIDEKQKKAKTRSIIPNLIHHVHDEGVIKYLVRENDELHVKEFALIDDQLYRPKQDLPIETVPKNILSESKTFSGKILLSRIENFLRSHVEFPYEQHYLICALWLSHTYFIEKLSVTPILYFFGLKETGKTRAGEVIYYLAFKAERLTSPTEACLFRAADYFKTTLIIDEIKLWGPDGNMGVANLIKSRYKRGIKVSRVNLNKSGEDQIEYFDVFAPLVICSTEAMPPIVQSRCITIIMQQNTDPAVERDIDTEEAEKIRKMLTILRFNHYNQDLPQVEPITRRRLNEITKPLLIMCKILDPGRLPELIDFIQYEEMRVVDEEGDSIEAEILRLIDEHHELRGTDKFLTREIVDALNRGKSSEKDKRGDRFVASCISRLGFEKTRLSRGPEKGKRGFKHDEILLEKLKMRYGIADENINLVTGDGSDTSNGAFSNSFHE